MTYDESKLPDLPVMPKSLFLLTTHEGLLGEKIDLSYRLFELIELDNINICQSLLNGSLFRDCKVRASDFSRCDLEAVRMENCQFNKTKLEMADIRSCTFINVTFIECSFNESYINDCVFDNCIFEKCDLSAAIISESSFLSSNITNCLFLRSTIVLNRYDRCFFGDTVLGDATFLLHIMRNCRFFNCKINADSIGYIYGLTKDDLKLFNYLFLGRDEKFPPEEDILQLILKEFVSRKWVFGYSLIRLNYRLATSIMALREMFSYFVLLFKKDLPIKRDELVFFQMVIDELKKDSQLPMYNIIEMLRILDELLSDTDKSGHGSVKHILSLRNKAYFALDDMKSAIYNCSPISALKDYKDSPVLVRMVFHVKPSLGINDLLDLATYKQLPIKFPTVQVLSEMGSYIEILTTSIITLAFIQAILYLANGCIVQITEMKTRIKVLSQEDVPAYYSKLAETSKQSVPPLVDDLIKASLDSVVGLGWTRNDNLSGYEKENIQSIDVLNTSE